ncbi:MAG: hypothetical protein AAF550_10865, partial [Myxococcota bacterium]
WRWWKSRRKKKPKPKKNPFGRFVLVQAYRRYLKELPEEAVRELRRTPHFVVFGTDERSKMALIDAYSGWRTRANQRYPSSTADPHVRFFLGESAAIVDISTTLAAETTLRAKAATVWLWRWLYRRRPPTVIIALDAQSWERMPAQDKDRFAGSIRAHVHEIAKCSSAVVPVRVVLFGADCWSGYRELAFSCGRSGRGVVLRLAGGRLSEEIDRALEELQGAANYSLLVPPSQGTRGAIEFRGALSFLKEARDTWLQTTRQFLEAMTRPDALLRTPTIATLHLVPSEYVALGNPFSAVPSGWQPTGDYESYLHKEERWLDRYPWVPRYAAVAAAILVLAAFPLARYLSDLDRLAQAEVHVEAYERTSVDEMIALRAAQALPPFDYGWLPGFFTWIAPDPLEDEKAELRKRFVARFRTAQLRARLRDADERTYLQTLGLIYAVRGAPLWDMAMERYEDWAGTLDVALVRAYLDQVQERYARTDMPAFTGRWTSEVAPYLERMQRVMQRDSITTRELRALTGVRWDEAWLRECGRLSAELRGLEVPLTELRVKGCPNASDEMIAALGAFDAPGILESRKERFRGLPSMVEHLREIRRRVPEEQRVHTVRFGDRQVELSEQSWWRLLLKSEIERVQVDCGLGTSTARFFEFGGALPDVEVRNPPPVRTDGSVSALYTRRAFESAIRPQLAELGDLLAEIDPHRDWSSLRRCVQQQADRYAADYAAKWQSYVGSMSLSAGNSGDLVRLIQAMQVPGGAWDRFWTILADNLAVRGLPLPAESESPEDGARAGGIVAPIEDELRRLRPVAEVVGGESDSRPLDDYVALLSELLEPLEEEFELESPELSGAEQILLDDLSGEESPLASARAMVRGWGVQGFGQAMFLVPIETFERVGRSRVNRRVSTRWRQEYLPEVRRMVAAYPFASETGNEVTPEELSELLGPDGTLGELFAALFDALCTRSPSGVVACTRGISLPDGMSELEQALSRLRGALFDDEGAPRPVALRVRPTMFRLRGADECQRWSRRECVHERSAGCQVRRRRQCEEMLLARTGLEVGESRVQGLNSAQRDRALLWNWWEHGNPRVFAEFESR